MDAVEIAPTLTGPGGKAWELDMPAILRRMGADADRSCAVGCWIVEAPWAHPMWHSYVISVVHLRPMPKLPAPIIHVPGATHEIVVDALDPDYSRTLAITEGKICRMTPTNFAAQFIEPNATPELQDAAAKARGLASVEAILAGDLSPDTDFIKMWVARFNGAMLKR